MIVSMCGCGFPKYDCHCAELIKMAPEEQRRYWVASYGDQCRAKATRNGVIAFCVLVGFLVALQIIF